MIVVGGGVAVLLGSAGTRAASPPPATPGLPTCTGHNLKLSSQLTLDKTKTHVIATYGVRGLPGRPCRFRGAVGRSGVIVSTYLTDERGVVALEVRNFDSRTSTTFGGDRGGVLPGSIYTLRQNPTRKAWCSTGGHRFTFSVRAAGAATASATAVLCPYRHKGQGSQQV